MCFSMLVKVEMEEVEQITNGKISAYAKLLESH